MQRSFEERLRQMIWKMDDTQKSRLAELDESLRQVHSSLLDIAISIRRLEDKVDRGSERMPAIGLKYHHTSLQQEEAHSLAAGDKQPTKMIFTHGCSRTSGADSQPGFEKKCQDANNTQQQDLVIRESKVVEGKADLQNEAIAHQAGENFRPANFCRELQSGDLDAKVRENVVLEAAVGLSQLDTKLIVMDKKLEKITATMGIRSGANMGDDEEDRKRLKEKLKLAIELDKQSHVTVSKIVSNRELWMEYIFGICSPEPRTGKRGSR